MSKYFLFTIISTLVMSLCPKLISKVILYTIITVKCKFKLECNHVVITQYHYNYTTLRKDFLYNYRAMICTKNWEYSQQERVFGPMQSCLTYFKFHNF